MNSSSLNLISSRAELFAFMEISIFYVVNAVSSGIHGIALLSKLSKLEKHPHAQNAKQKVLLPTPLPDMLSYLGIEPPPRALRRRLIGTLRPDIVLYGEHQPNSEDIAKIINHNLLWKPDMLLVMGTSLSIESLNIAIKAVAKEVKKQGGLSIFINRTAAKSMGKWKQIFDYHVESEVDDWVRETVNYWMEIKPSDWEIGVSDRNSNGVA